MEIKQQIREFITSNFYVSDLSSLDEKTSLLDRGIIDSTGVLEVIGFIEETFDIKVDDREMLPENFDSVERIAAFICRKQDHATQRLLRRA